MTREGFALVCVLVVQFVYCSLGQTCAPNYVIDRTLCDTNTSRYVDTAMADILPLYCQAAPFVALSNLTITNVAITANQISGFTLTTSVAIYDNTANAPNAPIGTFNDIIWSGPIAKNTITVGAPSVDQWAHLVAGRTYWIVLCHDSGKHPGEMGSIHWAQDDNTGGCGSSVVVLMPGGIFESTTGNAGDYTKIQNGTVNIAFVGCVFGSPISINSTITFNTSLSSNSDDLTYAVGGDYIASVHVSKKANSETHRADIYYTYVLELDSNNNVVKTLDLRAPQLQSRFVQVQSIGTTPSQQFLLSTLALNNSTVISWRYFIDPLNATTFEIAGVDITVPANLLKWWLRIDNWPFANSSNTLRLIAELAVPDGQVTETLETLNGNLHNVVYNLATPKYNATYRVHDFAVFDNQTKTVYSAISGSNFTIDMPYFSSFMEIDPDLSIVLTGSQSGDGDSNTNLVGLWIAIGVGVPLLCCILLICILVIMVLVALMGRWQHQNTESMVQWSE